MRFEVVVFFNKVYYLLKMTGRLKEIRVRSINDQGFMKFLFSPAGGAAGQGGLAEVDEGGTAGASKGGVQRLLRS